MADLTDVETAITQIVDAAIYPNGDSQPSSLPGHPRVGIGRGWPLPATLDNMLAAGAAQVTVYPLAGSATPTYQLLRKTHTVQEPAINLAISIDASGVITVSGAPADGEFLTVVADDLKIYSFSGTTAAAILQSLVTAAQVDYPSASATSTTLTIPVSHKIEVRQGGKALMGRVSHRQRHSIMVSVWAPSDALRTAIAVSADIALKNNNKIVLPDTSRCVLRYQRTTSSDQQEKAGLYRRDLIYEAEFATLETFAGYTVTSVQVSIAKPDNAAVATAII